MSCGYARRITGTLQSSAVWEIGYLTTEYCKYLLSMGVRTNGGHFHLWVLQGSGLFSMAYNGRTMNVVENIRYNVPLPLFLSVDDPVRVQFQEVLDDYPVPVAYR